MKKYSLIFFLILAPLVYGIETQYSPIPEFSEETLSSFNEKMESISRDLKSLKLGAWASRAENTAYQATTDGYFSGLMIGTANDAGIQRITGYTDSNTTPTTPRGYAFLSGHANANWANGKADSFTITVRKNDYYRAVKTDVAGTITSTRTYYWIPFGR